VLANNLISLMTDDFATWTGVNLEPSEPLKAERQFFNLQDSWSKALTLRPDFLAQQIASRTRASW